MATWTAVGAWDTLPVGCAVLVIVLLSLLSWAISWFLLSRLFGTEEVAHLTPSYLQRVRLRVSGIRFAPVAQQC
jgi:hypothetical protein